MSEYTAYPVRTTTNPMILTNEHIEILRHTRDRAAGGFYCGNSRQMRELVAAGLMVSAGCKSFVPDEYFKLTEKGREEPNKSQNEKQS